MAQDKVTPSQADNRAYHLHEYFGMVMLWHVHLPPASSNQFDEHIPTKAEAEVVAAKAVPLYFPPRHPSLESGDMVYAGERSCTVNMNIREFAENSTDFAVNTLRFRLCAT